VTLVKHLCRHSWNHDCACLHCSLAAVHRVLGVQSFFDDHVDAALSAAHRAHDASSLLSIDRFLGARSRAHVTAASYQHDANSLARDRQTGTCALSTSADYTVYIDYVQRAYIYRGPHSMSVYGMPTGSLPGHSPRLKSSWLKVSLSLNSSLSPTLFAL